MIRRKCKGGELTFFKENNKAIDLTPTSYWLTLRFGSGAPITVY